MKLFYKLDVLRLKFLFDTFTVAIPEEEFGLFNPKFS